MQFYLTDVFGHAAYSGNQLATFVGCVGLSDDEMQQIAREINFSETTFVLTEAPDATAYKVRIFTPNEEIDFAGHPTLGTAYVIREHVIGRPVRSVSLSLGVGTVPVSFPAEQDGGDDCLWMQQPQATFGETFERRAMAGVLGLEESDIADAWPVMAVSTGLPHIVVPLASGDALSRIVISDADYDLLIENSWARSLAVFTTAAHEPQQSIAVRVFARYYGVPEDPATGSGNGCIAAYLAQHRVLGDERVDIRSGQGYEMGRPSEIALQAEPLDSGLSVRVGGRVIPIASGEWPVHARP